jgi:hypothetical protein
VALSKNKKHPAFQRHFLYILLAVRAGTAYFIIVFQSSNLSVKLIYMPSLNGGEQFIW